MDWKGSVFKRKGKLALAVKVAGRWVQVATPYRPGQEKEARALLERTRERILAGEESGLGIDPTVAEYAKPWLEQRKGQIASWQDDESRLGTHILPSLGSLPLAAVRPRHVAAMVASVRRAGLAPRTVRNVYTVVRAIFRDAQIAGLCDSQPCILNHHQLGKVRDAKHEWRAAALFSEEELASLTGSSKVPQDRRVLYALGSFGCLRHGEAAALRWRHVVSGLKPLGRLVIANSNATLTTKTGVERWMPMHPILTGILAAWRLGGWPRAFGRPPHADDLVVPHTKPTNRGPRVKFGGMRSDHDSYKRLRIDCRALELRPRRFHDLRRAGITFYREAGADKDVLRLCTHGGKGDVIEQYTSFGWAKLSGAIVATIRKYAKRKA